MTWRTLCLYGLPALVAGYAVRLLVLYAMKFSTDILLIAPFIIGSIFGLARIWDAVTDPLVGYWSDRTKLRFGRRRTWILAGAIPAGATYAMVFSPPQSLSEFEIIVWLSVAILGFYTAVTVVAVPHLSWGAELVTASDDRNRLFGARHVFETIGGLVALGTLSLLIAAQADGLAQSRAFTSDVAILAGAVSACFIIACVIWVPERQVAATQTPRGSILLAGKDIWANPHARLALIVILIELIGSATMGTMAIYVAEYVIGAPQVAPMVIIIYLMTQMATVPLAVKAARRIQKHKLWLYSMVMTGFAFGGMFLLAFIDDRSHQIAWNIFTGIVAGVAAAVGGTVGPSVLSDIIDYDEYTTGERKEGAYFAIWNFAGKAAGGITLMFAGIMLSSIGFVPNVEQSFQVKVGLTGLLGLFPLVCYWLGAWLFTRYRLDDDACRAMRAELDARAARNA